MHKSLALLYEKGEGIKKSIESAVYQYAKAVRNGCQEANESLDKLLSNNKSNDKSKVKLDDKSQDKSDDKLNDKSNSKSKSKSTFLEGD
jgi:TPR repeat protein